MSYCAAKWCCYSRYSYAKLPAISFHRFPKDPDRCRLWCEFANREDLLVKSPLQLNSSYVLCRHHFTEDQFMHANSNRLIHNAVPTLRGTSEYKDDSTPSLSKSEGDALSSELAVHNTNKRLCTEMAFSSTTCNDIDTRSESNSILVLRCNDAEVTNPHIETDQLGVVPNSSEKLESSHHVLQKTTIEAISIAKRRCLSSKNIGSQKEKRDSSTNTEIIVLPREMPSAETLKVDKENETLQSKLTMEKQKAECIVKRGVGGGGNCCSAPNCHNRRKKNHDISFFRFPRDPERCKRWVMLCGRRDLLNKDANYLYMNCRICAVHFETRMFLNPVKTKLIHNAVPTLFDIPDEQGRENVCEQATSELIGPDIFYVPIHPADGTLLNISEPLTTENTKANSSVPGKTRVLSDAELQNNSQTEEMSDELMSRATEAKDCVQVIDTTNTENMRKAIHYDTSPGCQNRCDFISESNLAGLEKKQEVLPLYIQYKNLSEQKLILYTGLSKKTADALLKLMQQIGVTIKCKLQTAEQMLLVLMRLKLGLLIEDLADRFSVSPSVANKIFRSWIYALKTVLGTVVCDLPEDTIKQCFPLDLREKYRKKACVVDCFELFTQEDVKKDKIFTLHNSNEAIKFFIAVAPLGYIMGTSHHCCQQKDEQDTMLSEKFIKMLQSQEEVIVSEKLQVESEISKTGVKVTSLSYDKTYSQAKTKELPFDFNEVERILKQIKKYNILNTVLPFKNVPFIEDVVLVIFALVNLKLSMLERLIKDAGNNDAHLCLRCKEIIVGQENYEVHQNRMCISTSKKPLLDWTKSKQKTPATIYCRALKSVPDLKLHDESTIPGKLLLTPEVSVAYKLINSSAMHPMLANKHKFIGNKQPYNFEFLKQTSAIDNSHAVSSSSQMVEFCKDTNSISNSGGFSLDRGLSTSDKSHIVQTDVIIPMPVNKDNFIKIFSRHSTKKIECNTCRRSFPTKMQWMDHVLRQEHRQKFRYTYTWQWSVLCNQIDLIQSSLFQCLICHFYFNNREAFDDHLKSSSHIQKVAKLSQSLLCVSCNFEFVDNEGLLDHFGSKKHQDTDFHISQFHPIVIKIKLDEECQYCNGTCQLTELYNTQQKLRVSFVMQNNSKDRRNEMQNQNITGLTDISNNTPSCTNRALGRLGNRKTRATFKRQSSNKSVCQVTQNDNSQDLSHLTLEELKDHFYCHRPKRKLSIKQDTKGHKKDNQAIKNSKNKYQCTYCNKTFVKSIGLKEHIFSHKGEKPYICEICGRAFSSKSVCFSHRRIHSGIKHFKCDKCDFRTFRKASLLNHQQTHSINRPRNFMCEICGATYYNRGNLSRHMQFHNGRKHKCTHPGCHRAFSTPWELTEHMRIHTNQKPFLCDICGFSARTHIFLKQHRDIHFERKYYKCQHCSYTSYMLHRIQNHILKTNCHSAKTAFVCKFCEFIGNGMKEYRDHLSLNHLEKFPYGKKEMDSLLLSNMQFETVSRRRGNLRWGKNGKSYKQKAKLKLDATESNKNSLTFAESGISVDGDAEENASNVTISIPECGFYIEIPS